jgi:hypothetical protein
VGDRGQAHHLRGEVMRAKRHRPTRDELERAGAPIRLSDLAQMVGWSRQKLLTDAQHGNLTVAWVKCGTRRMATVARQEAARYYDDFYYRPTTKAS